MRFFRDLIRAALVTVAVILALEAGLRLAHERYDASLFQPEGERGYCLRPLAEGWNVTGGEAYIKINSQGMRDRERPVQRPVDALRVAVLGASDAEAREVPLEQTFEAEMERQMATRLAARSKGVDVLNFGVTGYTHAQQYLTLHNHVWKYDPQVVVIIWNQFLLLKNTPATDPQGPEGDRVPFYTVRGGHLEAAEPTASLKALRSSSSRQIEIRNRFADWMNASYLLCTMNWARVQLQKQVARFQARLHHDVEAAPTNAHGPPADYMQWWPYAPSLPEMQENWEIGEAFIKEMKADCERHGAEFWIVISDEEMQSHPNLAVRNAFMRSRNLPSLNESDRRVEQFCERNGVHVLTLAQPVGEYAVSHGVALHGLGTNNAGHWNKLGNEVVGRLIAGELERNSAIVRSWDSGSSGMRSESAR
jgi:hypothetical protein